MATGALARRLEEVQEATKSRLARARQVAMQQANAQKHTLIACAAGYGIGMAEKKGVQLPTAEGISPALLYGGLALGAAYMIKDKGAQQIAQSAADGLLSICAYKQGKGEAIIGEGSGG
jgi:hypothetical protein